MIKVFKTVDKITNKQAEDKLDEKYILTYHFSDNDYICILYKIFLYISFKV